MIRQRLGSATLLLLSVAAPAAAGPERPPETDLLARARAAGDPVAASGGVQQTGVRSGPVFLPGGSWARAEMSALLGSQLVNQDLGFSRNIFQTVSAKADDVGFGEHFGARGAFFVSRYLGAEAAFTRTTTEFEFQVTDEEAGVTVFEENLVQESREVVLAAVAQLPLAAMTPYAAVGYGWRNSEVEGGDPFRAAAAVLGLGIKVPFPRIPVALAFDYRHVRYGAGDDDGLQLTEGGTGGATVSALTFGVVVRFAVNR